MKSQGNLGLRTFPTVTVASCGCMLIALHRAGSYAETMTRALQECFGGMG